MDTRNIIFKIQYRLSDKYRNEHAAKHGERPSWKQTLEIPAKEIGSEGLRARLLKAATRSGGNGQRTDYKLTVTAGLLGAKNKRQIGSLQPNRSTSIGSDKVRIDDYPKFSPNSVNIEAFVPLDGPIEAEDLGRVLDKIEEKRGERRKKYKEALEETAEKVAGVLEKYLSEDEEVKEKLQKSGPRETRTDERPLLLGESVLKDLDGTSAFGRIQELQEKAKRKAEDIKEARERRKKEREEKKKREKERREAERQEWIEEHGSDHLQLAFDEGYDCQRRYAIERAEAEHDERFYLDFEGTCSCKSRSCPSEEALKFAQETGGKVVWLTEPGKQDPEETPHRHFEGEAVRKRIQLGEHGRRYDLLKEFG